MDEQIIQNDWDMKKDMAHITKARAGRREVHDKFWVTI